MSSIVVTPKTSRCTGAVLSRWTMLDHSLPILAELNLAEIRYSTQITHIFLKKGKKNRVFCHPRFWACRFNLTLFGVLGI